MSDDHPERGRLQAYLDGELDPEAANALAEHLERCERCRVRLDRHRAWSSAVSDVAALVDVPEPEMELPEPDGTPSPAGGGDDAADVAARLGPFRRRSVLRAAAVVFLVAGGAFAVTSTPLRAFAGDLLEGVTGLFGDGDGRPVAGEVRNTSLEARDPGPSAASIRAHEGRLEVVVRTSGSQRPAVRVGFRSASAAVVEAPGASFGTSPGRLVVEASGPDTLVVELPEGVRNARVEVDGRTLLRVRGDEVIHDVTPHTMNGDYLYPPDR